MKMKQRRGSTDLEWISKYQHSDHHVDRQTRKKMEGKGGEFPLGLPPTPSYTSSRRTKHVDNDDLVTKRYSISPRTNELISMPLNFRRRSNSLSPTVQPISFDHVTIGSYSPLSKRNSLAYKSPVVSLSMPASRRVSVCEYVTPSSLMSSLRSSRAMSVPIRYTSPYSVVGSRTSCAVPAAGSESFQTIRRSSLAPRLESGLSDLRRTSIYNNFNNKCYDNYTYNGYNNRYNNKNNYDNIHSNMYNNIHSNMYNNKYSNTYNNRYSNTYNNKYSNTYNNRYNNNDAGLRNSFVSTYYTRPTIISRY